MTYWQDTRKRLKEMTTSTDMTMMVYKKVATSKVNMMQIIKPSFYVGQLATLSNDFTRYVDQFLDSEERDWGEYIKFCLYIREISKRIVGSIQSLEGPLFQLIVSIEEILEGERTIGDYYEEDVEPEEIEEPENLDILEEKEEEDENEDDEEEESASGELKICREELASDHEALMEDLRVKLRQADVPPRVVKELSTEVADVYLEAIQLNRELDRLSRCPDGDLSTLLSILIDIQYGLCLEMKRHLFEDITVDQKFVFKPGLLTWTAHFLSNFSDKINEELKMEE